MHTPVILSVPLLLKNILFLFRYGGWDGKKWLSDVYIMDTSSKLLLYPITEFFLEDGKENVER